MMKHEIIELSGTITDIFAHRFVIDTKQGRVLADIGPEGAELFVLKPGLAVHVEGERKPSEVKVFRISSEGGATIEVHHRRKHEHGPKHEHAKKPGHKKHEFEDADPEIAVKAAKKAGYKVLGDPRRKPRHFDLLVRKKDGSKVDLHVEIDGTIKKEKPPKPVHA
jgi:hypothetical protein